MRKTIIIPTAVILCSISMAHGASNGGQAVPAPIGTHELPATPSSMASPSAIGNGYLNCTPTLPMADGHRGHAPVSMTDAKPL